jgi:thiol-disulfide isomerase/thioredoxin
MPAQPSKCLYVVAALLYAGLALAANPTLALDPATLEALRAGEMRKLVVHAEPLPAPDTVFTAPDGSETTLAASNGRIRLVNFWATWCAPCIKEMPELDRFARAQGQRLQVIGLAIDRMEPVQEFLTRHPVSFAIGLAGMDGTDLARSLGNPAGALPFTVLLDAKGKIVQRRLGETRQADLEAWAKLLEAPRS